ncbi:hypothetical protein FQN60_016678, partial [Etheostoma spectabile]
MDYDVALLEMSVPAPMSYTIQSVCLPSPVHRFLKNAECYIIGWGSMREGVDVMRFNEKELVSLSRQPSEMAAELGMRGPKKGDALLLEQCRVEKEDSQSFSIAFLDEAERKYLFECDSAEQCREWVDSIVKARRSSEIVEEMFH